MKLVTIFGLAALLGVNAMADKHEHNHVHAAETTSAGKIVADAGKIFSSEHGMVVRKVLKAGEKIPSHNHKGEEIFFSVMVGKIKVALNDQEIHDMKAGDTLQFSGTNFISAEALEDTQVLISLIKQ